ncbi:MAG: aminotransferase [Cytophagales bacterium CG12_big_fil_rev_8_21_14_0_65_40_12]|nr:MAG: aminotransferase [Cytophagales bacterium CG12_big_fil_rev_8_21_14_0_65_40_12]PIW06267.1 MAG: aminotransferase [Cytophagales bacterium CG17_big_fil_post_rev_8_21_14_2_50_40_13]
MNKRDFLKKASLMGITASPFISQIEKLVSSVEHLSPLQLASDEDFWAVIRADYKLKPDYINLENGYYCFLPQPTLNHLIDHINEVNYQGSYYMRTVQWENKKKVAEKLASIVNCSTDELVITRNTTESLDTIIGGFPWQAGDEAIMARQDYGAMINMFRQVERRQGIKRVVIDVPMHPQSDEEVVAAYEAAITKNTKLLMVCHLVNITGHILPIRKICDMAHAKGVEVMVDGAHAFAQIEVDMKALDCDYYGTSLHKWMSVPLGAGFLYVKKSKIAQIWPLFAEEDLKPDDIRRLNHTGTHPVYTDLAIANAIDYHNTIGLERKSARLRFLQNYWTDQVRDLDHIVLNTPKDRQRSCAIANVGIKGMKPAELSKTLLEKYKIWTVAIDGAGVHGCRITPNVYTTLQELDVFVAALKDMA